MHRAGLFANAGSVVREAAALGLAHLGYRVIPQIPGAWEKSQAERNLDAVVVHGLRGRSGEAAEYYGSVGADVALIDLPHLRVEGQYRVTPARHDWLPTFEGLPPIDRLEALGIEPLSRKRVKSQSVLFVGQVGGDSAHGMDGGAYRRWAAKTLETIRSLTDSKITWRPHPEDRWFLEGVDGVSDPQLETLTEALDRSWVVVTYNSTAGLEALISGLPVVAEGPAVYSDLSWRLNMLPKLGPPGVDDVRDLLAAIAYTQWTPGEIASGLPLEMALRDQSVLPGRAAIFVTPPVEPEPPLLASPPVETTFAETVTPGVPVPEPEKVESAKPIAPRSKARE